MSGSRDRLGLLLPIPALLIAGSAHARIPGSSSPSQDAREADEAVPTEPTSPPSADDDALPPELAPSPGDANDAPASDGMPAEARARYDRGRAAFEAGRYADAGADFERAAAMAPELVLLPLQAAIAFRHAAEAEPDPTAATELCTAVRRNTEAVANHPQAAPEQIEQARAESTQADAHCTRANQYAFDVIETPVTFGPCLTPPHDPEPRGCAHRRHGPTAMLGGLLLLGLRSRRRRDAVERMADRLPPDVAERLRRSSPPTPDEDDA